MILRPDKGSGSVLTDAQLPAADYKEVPYAELTAGTVNGTAVSFLFLTL